MQLPTIRLASLRWAVLVASLATWVGTVLWVTIELGGLGSRGAKLFNWHPVLASCAMLVLFPHGILSWRSANGSNGAQTKWIHAVLLSTAFILLNVAVSMAFFSHVQQKLPNFYSLHSWIGMLAIGTMKGNIVGGLLSSFSTYVRSMKLVSQVHRLSGVLACVFGFTAMLLGFAKEQEFVVQKSGKPLGPSAIIGGALGLISLLVGVAVTSSLVINSEKKGEHHPGKNIDEELPRCNPQDNSVDQIG